MRTAAAALTLAALATGCGHKVTVSYLEPAAVDIDTDLQKVLVINRSLPGNAGESILGATEGLATGEGFDLDADTSALALEALLDVLDDTDRYEVISFRVDGREVDTSVWDRPLDVHDARKLCKKAHCDAIIALDSLDTDTTHLMTAEGQPRDREFTGTTETDLVASFRVYDDQGQIVDEARLTVDGSAESTSDHRREATEAFAAGPELQAELARQVGTAYGERIAPHEVEDTRKLYRSGAPELKDAWKYAKAGDWEAASKLWRLMLDDRSEKVQAKARYNLAVAAELRGDLDRAIALARRAQVDLDRSRVRHYVGDLEERSDDSERLARQIGSVSPTVVVRR